MAFYRKYRSQRISELDLESLREGLLRLVRSGRVPHALLFSGPRGSGKTSAARILAKAVNCLENDGKDDPCGKCAVCEEISAGNFLDLIEIDGASNRGIDDIRLLKERISLAPSAAKKKVYIIDEVHMLTKEAFNALLKTLEEPPSHAMFILCTTEPEKLPETIISRCMRFDFHKATAVEIGRCLERVVKGEGLKVGKGVLELIGKKVDGSFRDAQKILEQLSFEEGEISLKRAKELLGEIEILLPEKLLGFLIEKKAKEAVLLLATLEERGTDWKKYLQGLLGKLRELLLARIGIGEIETVWLAWGVGELKELIGLFSQAAAGLKEAPLVQLPLEVAVLEWCLKNGGLEEGGEEEDKKEPIESELPKTRRKPVVSKKTLVVPAAETKETIVEEKLASLSGEEMAVLKKIESDWARILAGVRPQNHSIEALLRATKVYCLKDNFLTLQVGYQFHKERLEDVKIRAIVEGVLEEVTGSPLKLKCVLRAESPQEIKRSERERENTNGDDLLAAAKDIFSGEVVN